MLHLNYEATMRTFACTLAILLGITSATLPNRAMAQTPCSLPVSAFLTDSEGEPLHGSIDVELQFFVDPADGASPSECRSYASVGVDRGWLRVDVDACAEPVPDGCGAVPVANILRSAPGLWVGVLVDGVEIGPRIAVGAVPYAVEASNARTLQGLDPDAFEHAGSVESHAADPDAHHSATPADPEGDGFYLHPNGVTVLCPDVRVGAEGLVGGVVYTKRDWHAITILAEFAQELLVTACTSSVPNMGDMFRDAYAFNQDIGSWDTSSVLSMRGMFRDAHAFNQDISNWDTSNVLTMGVMFEDADAFNQDIGDWDTSRVTDMGGMFRYALIFNHDIGDWDTSRVTDMRFMFSRATAFNQDLGSWHTSNITDMYGIFEDAVAFNQDIGGWNTNSVLNMTRMFYGATAFNQDLSGWCVERIGAEPLDFDLDATSWVLPRPVWGTCP